MGMKSRTRKTWREKFENVPEGLPKVVEGNTATWEKRLGGRRVLIATPKLVDEVIRRVRKGKLITINQIRERLARDFKADAACPLTTGIFVHIVSEVAEEDRKAGKKDVTPYWRVLKSDGKLNEKYPGGAARQARMLRSEGHRIEMRNGKGPLKVKDYERRLQAV